jgi:twinkle protein
MCDSSDALSVYHKKDKQGRTYHDAWCFSCARIVPNPPGFTSYKDLQGGSEIRSVVPVQEDHDSTHYHKNTIEEVLKDFKSYPIRALSHRGISKEAVEKYGVRVSLSPTDGETILTHKYPYYKESKLSGYKERIVETKTMYSKGDVKGASLFGIHCTNPGGKNLFITEGELDALSLYQTLKSLSTMPGWEPAVVSLSHGASSAAKDISTDLDFVQSFDKIVLVFDQDEAGQRAVDEACKLLSGKVYIAKLSEKDPNDMLRKGKGEEMKWEVLKHARQYMPDSIVNYANCYHRLEEDLTRKYYGWPTLFAALREMHPGPTEGDLITLTSGTGMGKTQLLTELRHFYHETTHLKFSDIVLEDDLGRTMSRLMSIRLNQRAYLPKIRDTIPREKRDEARDYYFADGRWAGIDYFGGLRDDNLFSKIRWFAANGHKMIFLDHISIIVSEFAIEGSERERIDTLYTRLKKIAKELNLIIFAIIHLKKADGTSFEQGAIPDLDDLRGSSTPKQLSDFVMCLSRNQQHQDPFCRNTSLVTVLKNRLTGDTGNADYLHFDLNTGRMHPVPCPSGYHPPKRGQSSLSNQPF